MLAPLSPRLDFGTLPANQMNYLCVQCDETFSHEGEDRPRCPKCMRVRGLREAGETSEPQPPGAKRWMGPVLLVVALAAGGYAYWQRGHGPEAQAAAAVDALAGKLKQSGVDAGALVGLLEADEALDAFAEQAAAGAADPVARARAVVAALRKRAELRAFVPWSLVDAREGPPMPATAVLKAIQMDSAEARLYPLEVASLAVAAMRSLGIAAHLGAAYAYPAQTAPPDPSGRLGYFAAVVSNGDKELWLDPYGARSQQPAPEDRAIMADAEAVAAALALSALGELSAGKVSEALTLADSAVKLWPDSPSVRCARAAVLIGSGGLDQGRAEVEAALQLRSDAPRRNNLALMYLAGGDVDRAAKEVGRALQESPDYGSGLITLAGVQLATREPGLARESLEKAERLTPDDPALVMAWAEYHVSVGELDQAVLRARQSVELRPSNPQSHLMLGRLYRMAGRYSEMQASAREVMRLTPPERREQVRGLVLRLLGATALEDPEPGASPDAGTSGAAQLNLSAGSKLLGGQGTPSGGPSLMGGRGGDLKLGTDAPKLQLGGADSKLKLQLDP